MALLNVRYHKLFIYYLTNKSGFHIFIKNNNNFENIIKFINKKINNFCYIVNNIKKYIFVCFVIINLNFKIIFYD